MHNPRLIPAALLLGLCLVFDVWFIAIRCNASPPVFVTGLVLGGVLQMLAIGVPLLAARRFHFEQPLFHLRNAALGAVCLALSIPVLQSSILCSDAMAQAKQYRATGVACGGTALRNVYGV
jgi:hypothetical protein